MCQEFCSQGGVCSQGGCLLLGGVCSLGVSAPGGVCSLGGVCSQGCVCSCGVSALRGAGGDTPPPTDTAAGGTHPTGMHSCLICFHKVIYLVITDNDERELLAIMFSCQWFNTYMLGRTFIIESDHQRLEMIHLKDVAGLQRMILKVQKYNTHNRPGKAMILAGTPSQCTPRSAQQIKLYHRLHSLFKDLDRGAQRFYTR